MALPYNFLQQPQRPQQFPGLERRLQNVAGQISNRTGVLQQQNQGVMPQVDPTLMGLQDRQQQLMKQYAQVAGVPYGAPSFGVNPYTTPQQRPPMSTMPVIGQPQMPQPGLQPMPMPQQGPQPQMPQGIYPEQQFNQQALLALQQQRAAMGNQDILMKQQQGLGQPLSASSMAEQAQMEAARARMLSAVQGPQALQPTQSAMLGNMAQNFPGTLGQAPAQGGLGNFMPTQTGLMNAPVGTPQQLPPGFNASPIRSDIDQTAMMNNMLAQPTTQSPLDASSIAYAQQQRLGGYDQMASQAQQQLMAQRQAQQPIGMQQTQFQRDAMVSPIKPMGAQQAQPMIQQAQPMGPQAMQTLGGAPRQASQPPRLGGI